MAQLNEAYAEFRVNPAIDFNQPEAAAQAALWQLVIALAATTLPRNKPKPAPGQVLGTARAGEPMHAAGVGLLPPQPFDWKAVAGGNNRVMAIPEAPEGPLYPEADLSDPFVCDQCKHSLPRHMIGGGCADCERNEPEHARCSWAGIQ